MAEVRYAADMTSLSTAGQARHVSHMSKAQPHQYGADMMSLSRIETIFLIAAYHPDKQPILDFGFWILDFGFWILDFRFWILDFGFWILDFVYRSHVTPNTHK